MRNLRFEPAPEPSVRSLLPPGFVHIKATGEEGGGGGLDALQAMFRSLQRRRLPEWGTLLELARSTPWLFQAVWWRYVEQRLLFANDAIPEVHVVIEQEACAANRITLSPTRFDALGLHLAVIDWDVTDADIAAMTRSTNAFFNQWNASPQLCELGRIERRPAEEVAADTSLGGGIYHPSGSTRMGQGPRDGIVNADLRCFRIPNLSVAATSVFPTGGGANPTMALMQASLRLADSLLRL